MGAHSSVIAVHNCRMQSIVWFVSAAAAEIAGCYAFWMWLRLNRSAWWAAAGVLALIAFAMALTRVDLPHAGRAYAVYGGIYIVASLGWLWIAEGVRPDRWDLIGSAICVVGALVILHGPRAG
jgi:small multidrug resistance family-3 protein